VFSALLVCVMCVTVFLFLYCIFILCSSRRFRVNKYSSTAAGGRQELAGGRREEGKKQGFHLNENRL
jgi:hypothetical protein